MVEHVLAPVRVADERGLADGRGPWATDCRRALLDRIDLIPLVIAPQRLAHLGRISGAVADGPRAVAAWRHGTRPWSCGSSVATSPAPCCSTPPDCALAGCPARPSTAPLPSGLDALLVGLDAEVVG